MGKNRKLFDIARRHLVGGVDSPVRSFNYVGGNPLLIQSGKAARVYDYEGKEYIDYVLSWGSLILGHAHPEVIKAVKEKIGQGLGFGATNQTEIELAEAIEKAIPFIDKIRFVNSGTEAVMGAVRLARGYTKRDKIIKFEHSYHGHADYLLVKGGSGLATFNIPASRGVPQDFIKHTLVAPFGDEKFIEGLFKKYGSQIAAVLVEPVEGNYGVVRPEIDFLKKLRILTKKYGALLIFDEVITGFRFHFGSAAQTLGIEPDLITLGKIIGGGLPIGAYGGKDEIMDHLAPEGKVYQASTFSGNPIVMQAGLSTLRILKRSDAGYIRAKELTEKLCLGLIKEAALRRINLKADYYEDMFSLKFQDKLQFARFYKYMLNEGVFFAPSEFEANFLSFAHTLKDIEKTLLAARKALERSASFDTRKY